MKDMTQEEAFAFAEAIKLLEEWPAVCDAHDAERDRRIRVAHAAGVSQPAIAKRMKVGRNKISAVLAAENSSDNRGASNTKEG